MARYIWRLVNVWFGIESARGTPVTAQRWFPKTDCSFDETAETIQNESSVWVLADSRGSEVVRKFAGGEISGNLEVNAIGYLILSVLGSASSTSAGGGAYTHDFSILESNSHPSLTTCVDDPVIGDIAYALTAVESITISANVWEYATVTATLKAKPGASATHTVSYTTDYPLLARHTVFKHASNLAGLSGASGNCITSFEITINTNLEPIYCIASQSPNDFLGKQISIEGSFTADFSDTAFRDYQLAGTERALRFEISDTATTIWTASNPWIKIDLPLASLTEFSRSQWNDEIVTQTCTFKGLYSQADGSLIDVVLTNTEADYTA